MTSRRPASALPSHALDLTLLQALVSDGATAPELREAIPVRRILRALRRLSRLYREGAP